MARTPNYAASGPVSAEPLEPRSLLSAPYDFAAVGIRLDATPGPAVFLAEGTIDAASAITGSMTLATESGPETTGSIDWTRYNRAPRGGFTFTTQGGFTPYASQTGTQFIADDRWSLGTFTGRAGDGSVRDMAILSESMPADAIPHTFEGFELQMARLTPGGGIEYFPLLVRADASTSPLTGFTFTYDLASGPQSVHHNVVSIVGGRITLDDGQVVIFAIPDGNMFLADLDNSDGIVGIASGRMRANLPLAMSGTFRAAVIATGPESREFFGARIDETRPDGTAALNVVVRLFSSFQNTSAPTQGTFEIFRQDQWDAGLREPVTIGTWAFGFGSIEGETGPGAGNFHIDLTGPAGRRVTILQTVPQAFAFGPLTTAGGGTEQLFGAGSGQAMVTGRPDEFTSDVGSDGHPLIYIDSRPDQSTDQAIYRLDLVNDVAGEPIVGELTSWFGPGGGRYFAGLSATGEIQAWRYDLFGWAYMNITRATPGAHAIIGDLFATLRDINIVGFGIGGTTQTLAGFDLSGNFVAYRQLLDDSIAFGAGWQFVDAEHNGLDGLGDVPVIVGGLSGWDATWGAAHFAGLDTDGDLLSIWWAPGMARWRVDNLSASAATPTLAGQVTALRTTWDGFQIAGSAAANGHVIVTWWAPGRDAWESRDMTAELGGPTLSGATITSHFNSWQNTMNIVGSDAAGEIRVFWWSSWAGWNIGSLSAGTAPELVPLAPWRMVSTFWQVSQNDSFSLDSSQSLLGHNADGDLVRLVWRSYTPDSWTLDNLTGGAFPYFT
jgi:hypothetical protein